MFFRQHQHCLPAGKKDAGNWFVETRTSQRGRKPVLSQNDIQNINQLIQQQPDITIHEITEKLDLHVSDETVRKAVLKLGYVYKKEIPAYFGTGASPMSGRNGKTGENIYRRTTQNIWCSSMKAVSTQI